MRLYTAPSSDFIADTQLNRIADKLKSAFFAHFRYHPGPAEVASWQNSLRAMAQAIQWAKLEDLGVVLEYQLPMAGKRLDCMLTGENEDGLEGAVIVELHS